MEKKYLPISVDITQAKILVLGGDQSAQNKVKILQRFNADVEIVTRKIIDTLKDSGIKYRLKNYEASDLDGYFMVYSCLNNEELDKQIVSDAKAKGILVNIHDKPAICQFISPAVYQHENMTVAVSSNGKNVFNSIRLRDHLREYLNKNIQKIIKL